MSRQVLILNVTRMGDLVQMGPLLARLHEEWPEVSIDLVVDRKFASVAALMTGLRDVLAFDFHGVIDKTRVALQDLVTLHAELFAWAEPLRERRYDRVINLTFNEPSTFLASYVGAPDRRGACCGWDGGTVIENDWMAYFTDIHRFRRLNRFNLVDVYALGGSGPGRFAPLRVAVTDTARAWASAFLHEAEPRPHQWIAVQAGASDAMKAWRPEHFGLALAHLCRRWSGGIVMIGTGGEQETIARVVQVYREAGGKQAVRNAAGRTSLEQLVALLADCRLLLTNDTGPMHLAVGVGTPVVDLSVGHVDFRETGPYGPGHWVVQPELDCAPCGFQQVCAHQSCKDRISTERMAELLWHVLGVGERPAVDPGFRLYQSGVDEDQLGTFRLVGGTEDQGVAWYGQFWRRYWYERFTGRPSLMPAPTDPPPAAQTTLDTLDELAAAVANLCRRADDMVQVATKRSPSVKRLRQLQESQRAERERAVAIGMTSPATLSPTVALVRTIQGDNEEGLDRLARFHAEAYKRWAGHIAAVREEIRRHVPTGGRRVLHLLASPGTMCANG